MQTHSLPEFEQEAARFAETLKPTNGEATMVTLSGELGAGKTTFARALLRHFGVEEAITSPTFVIEKIYKPTKVPFKRLVHIDAYRLKSAQELDVLGWRELLTDSGNLILLEWPEHVEGAILRGAFPIHITFIDENARTIAYGTERDA